MKTIAERMARAIYVVILYAPILRVFYCRTALLLYDSFVRPLLVDLHKGVYEPLPVAQVLLKQAALLDAE